MKPPKAGTPPKPYKLEMIRHGIVIFTKRYDLHAEAWQRGEQWRGQFPDLHTYTITDYTDRQPGAR